jgi:hypothetical protein
VKTDETPDEMLVEEDRVGSRKASIPYAHDDHESTTRTWPPGAHALPVLARAPLPNRCPPPGVASPVVASDAIGGVSDHFMCCADSANRRGEMMMYRTGMLAPGDGNQGVSNRMS